MRAHNWFRLSSVALAAVLGTAASVSLPHLLAAPPQSTSGPGLLPDLSQDGWWQAGPPPTAIRGPLPARYVGHPVALKDLLGSWSGDLQVPGVMGPREATVTRITLSAGGSFVMSSRCGPQRFMGSGTYKFHEGVLSLSYGTSQGSVKPWTGRLGEDPSLGHRYRLTSEYSVIGTGNTLSLFGWGKNSGGVAVLVRRAAAKAQ